jgi:Uncharacterised protein conserved in bacteria (DUF2336)
MRAFQEVVKELDGAITAGSQVRRAEIADNITRLFLSRAHELSEDEIILFDEVLTRLTIQIEISARKLLATRLAPIPNAPPRAIRSLAFDDSIEVASPVLSLSERLTDADLVENARRKSQRHMLAITKRGMLSEFVTDVLIERGDRDVLLSAVNNAGAHFSSAAFSILVHRAEGDSELTIGVGGRLEIPRYLFQQLVAMASHAVRTKLTAIHPEAFEKIREAVAEAAEQVEADVVERSLWRESSLTAPEQKDDDQNLPHGSDQQDSSEAQSLAALTSMLSHVCDLPIGFIDQAIADRKSETILILARAANLSWSTLKTILTSRRGASAAETETSRLLAAYERLNPKTAQEILQFYRARAKQQAATLE